MIFFCENAFFSRKRSSPGVLLSTEMRSGALNTKRDPMINFETHHIVIAKGKLFSISRNLNTAFHPKNDLSMRLPSYKKAKC